jgi:hypothetical protein
MRRCRMPWKNQCLHQTATFVLLLQTPHPADTQTQEQDHSTKDTSVRPLTLAHAT